MQHFLPPYYHCSRHYGLHSAATYSRIVDKLPAAVKRTSNVILVLIQILKAIVKLKLISCPQCGSMELPEVSILLSDRIYMESFLPHLQAPPPEEHCKDWIEVGIKNDVPPKKRTAKIS